MTLDKFVAKSDVAKLPLVDARKYLNHRIIHYDDKRLDVHYELVGGRSLVAKLYAPGIPLILGEYKIRTRHATTGQALIDATDEILDNYLKRQRTITIVRFE
jgi:hypothetical protein